jgi:hypothetical protein
MNQGYENLLKSFDAFCFNLSGKKEFVDEILKIRLKFSIRAGGYFYDPTEPEENKKRHENAKTYGDAFKQAIEKVLGEFNMKGMYPILETWVLFNDPTIRLSEGTFHFTEKINLIKLKEELSQCDSVEECKTLIAETFQYYPDAFIYVPQLSSSKLAEVLSDSHADVYRYHKKNNPFEGQKHIDEKEIKKLRQLLYASLYNKDDYGREIIIENKDGSLYKAKTKPLELSGKQLVIAQQKEDLIIPIEAEEGIIEDLVLPNIGLQDKDSMNEKLRNFAQAEAQRQRLRSKE